MISIDRSKVSAPESLQKRDRDGKTELDRAREHVNGPNAGASFDYVVYKSAQVKDAFENLFYGKCAYCESFYSKTQPVDVEHYRPKNKVEEDASHSGYWWLAMAWDNLLPSCIDCNRRREQPTPNPKAGTMFGLLPDGKSKGFKKITTGKQASFPLAGKFRASKESDDLGQENRLLLDPTRDRPEDHLLFHVDRANLIGLVYPKPMKAGAGFVLPNLTRDLAGVATAAQADGASAVGAVSIQVYGLNRLALVQARTSHLRELEFLLLMLEGLEDILDEISMKLLSLNEDRSNAEPADVLSIGAEIAFLERIKKKIETHRNSVRDRMRSFTEPSAPYSAQAQAWLTAYLSL